MNEEVKQFIKENATDLLSYNAAINSQEVIDATELCLSPVTTPLTDGSQGQQRAYRFHLFKRAVLRAEAKYCVTEAAKILESIKMHSEYESLRKDDHQFARELASDLLDAAGVVKGETK